MNHTGNQVSVIICAYTEERWDDLLAAVASMHQQRIAPLEVIVVVDHNPALLARARTNLQDVLVVENIQPRGLSGARNSGIAVASGQIIAFMDEDASALPDWLEQLIVHYDHPAVMGVGGSIKPLWLNSRPEWFPAEFNWVVGCTYLGMPQTAAAVRNLIGCNMSFRREVFEAVGGFRTGIGRVGTRPVGCEETELCIRVHQHMPKAELRYEPQAQVLHRVPATRSTWRYYRSRCYAEGLSKALVARYVGASDGLSSERTYTFHTLPKGVISGLKDAAVGLDFAGLQRAMAIVQGLLITTIGYLRGKLVRQELHGVG